ncbi:Acyl-CoA dehydrogenase FadE34 [Zhongshania aliphaticivorans]|uniref:Acyl-CoA dehydrogenase FadE34 n=1 Tax=Zhongshania aliphaticivorans TaxID=1470434 RepID=A0A5S9NS13_9GAMM|nr:acyl-CoA dehydrogenase family protein [Zhongshania aliphaticivorans]CAA0093419.1 Acyl-CoA dehydrogenase FadE34 [Zhongshania aliphaticivorans]CAA0111336.1 Acyl-CoA dehydrogenase FadE34 [Zhongshania aliphaticivorans]
MNLDFSEDDKVIQEQVDKYLSNNSGIEEVRSVLDGEKPYSADVWRGMAEMGLMGINVPAEYGGVETGYKSLCLVAQSLGKHAAAIPFSSTVYLVTEALVQFGSEEQKSHWLPKLASGELIGAFAVAETLEQVTVSSISCSVSGDVLNGTKLAVADGGIADIAIVLAKGEAGPAMFIVELSDNGFERKNVSTIDPAKNTATVTFNNAKAELLGVDGQGWDQLQQVYDRAAVLFAFEQIGGAQSALDMAVEYAKERYAFGRPIGSFQALKHIMADMYTALRLAESNCFEAAEVLATGSADLPLVAATARVSATKAYQLCTKDNIQVHGGMGFTWEFDCHIYYRRSNYQTLELGGLSVWEGKLVDLIAAQGGDVDSAAVPNDSSPEDSAFRKEVRAWLAENAPTHLAPHLKKSVFGKANTGGEDIVEVSKAWQRKKAEGGWAAMMWPQEYGGRGATPMQSIIWGQEEGVYSQLSGLFIIGLGMCGPTMIAYASEGQKKRYLPKLASGEEVWCQLFSEPGSGSDLAGLRTKAVKDGDEWVVNGQKIWTSGAQHSDYGILITRTDPTVAKHKGLTMFFVDMRSAGVDVRPIKQINGGSSFNEVYFEDVRIPDAQRLGEVGDGWRVALTTLMNERMAIGGLMPTGLADFMELVNTLILENDKAIARPDVKARLADYYSKVSGLKNAGIRSINLVAKGGMPGPENSISKLVAGELMQDLTKYAMDMQGFAAVIDDADIAEGGARFQAMLMRSPALRIEGGTDQILRNIISERVLGLPEEMRADKGLAFNDIPTGRG